MSRPNENEPESRLQLLDVYRGLAILFVMLFHFTAIGRAEYLRIDVPTIDVSFGYLGVQAFFSISGFCIYLTLERAKGFNSFLVRRISRLWPALIACALLTQTIVAWRGLPGLEISWLEWIASVFFLGDLGIPLVDGAYWSILVEVKFYLIFALIHKFSAKPFRALVLFYIVAAILATGLSIYLRVLGSALTVLTIFTHLPWFILGASFYLVYAKKATFSTVLVGTSLALLNVLVFGKEDFFEQFIAVLVVFVGFAVLLKFPMATVPAWLRFIGLISYPLYLVHQYVGFVLIRDFAPLAAVPRIAVTVSILILIAYLIHRLVEFRFRSALERFIFSWIAAISRRLGGSFGVLQSEK